MASLNIVLEEFSSKLDDEVKLLTSFNYKIGNFFDFFNERDEYLSIEKDVFDKKIGNFIREFKMLMKSVTKTSRKPSAGLRDIASLTQKFQNSLKKVAY